MKLPSLTPILLAALLLAPIKAFSSEINEGTFSGEITGGARRLGNEAAVQVVTPLRLENGTPLCGRVVTGFQAGRSRAVLVPITYESGAGVAWGDTW